MQQGNESIHVNDNGAASLSGCICFNFLLGGVFWIY